MASIGENERIASLSKIETALTRNGVKKLERESLTSIVLQKTWIAGEVVEFSINFYAEARKQKGKLYLCKGYKPKTVHSVREGTDRGP